MFGKLINVFSSLLLSQNEGKLLQYLRHYGPNYNSTKQELKARITSKKRKKQDGMKGEKECPSSAANV